MSKIGKRLRRTIFTAATFVETFLNFASTEMKDSELRKIHLGSGFFVKLPWRPGDHGSIFINGPDPNVSFSIAEEECRTFIERVALMLDNKIGQFDVLCDGATIRVSHEHGVVKFLCKSSFNEYTTIAGDNEVAQGVLTYSKVVESRNSRQLPSEPPNALPQ